MGGAGKIEWLTPGKNAQAHSVPFALSGREIWQEIDVALPPQADFGIVRIYLPAKTQPTRIDWIELKARENVRRWDF